ncbi:MAG TPA: iron ABC transporter substrate-binding protein [Planctomicrobium sp.]|nr:iron ABC transporter substrate-binding protein [Planctomicrobium sp.]
MPMMTLIFRSLPRNGLLSLWLVLAVAVTSAASMATAQDSLTVYSGRSKQLVEPLVEKFQTETGIKVNVRFGGTAQLALALQQEGKRSQCDVFWAQDTGALEQLTSDKLFTKLPETIINQTLPAFRSPDQTWVATSARARGIAYSPTRVSPPDLPKSVFDLTDPRWKGRIGWSPANASFQAFVTGMRAKYGEEKTKAWLTGVRENGAKSYPRNSPILDAIAAGEIDIGILNHYYLHQVKKDRPDFPVEQTAFADGDLGNLVFVAGVGVLESSKKQELAQKFLAFLLKEDSQKYFTNNVSEYAVTATEPPEQSPVTKAAPEIKYSDLQDLEGTLKLLRQVGLQ